MHWKMLKFSAKLQSNQTVQKAIKSTTKSVVVPCKSSGCYDLAEFSGVCPSDAVVC